MMHHDNERFEIQQNNKFPCARISQVITCGLLRAQWSNYP